MQQLPPTLGILGGMGPVTSAELLRTIYACNPTPTDQLAPHVVLFSLPAAPDRCASIHGGSEAAFIAFMTAQLARLDPLCDKIFIACCTAHYSLPAVPEPLRRKVISAMALADRELGRSEEPALLLASTGAYKKRLFQDQCAHADRLRELAADEQEIVMGMIFNELKCGHDPMRVVPALQRLLARHGTRTCVAGCTEFHLVARALAARGDDSIRFIDPLGIIAREFSSLVTRDA